MGRTSPDRAPKARSRTNYDKELVRDRTVEVMERVIGSPGKDQGSRLVWDCPACGKHEKYSIKKDARKGGCLVDGCHLAGYEDVFGMLAKLEDLDPRTDFRAILAKAYELLGLEPHAPSPPAAQRDERAGKQSGPNSLTPKKTQFRKPENPARTNVSNHSSGDVRINVRSASGQGTITPTDGADALSRSEALKLAARVYARILELCPLETRDRRYLRTRGLSYGIIKAGRFGTMSVSRARKVKAELQREFGREQLLQVPGFSEDGNEGRLKFTLTGNYILIPYHDVGGNVTTIEGRCVGEPPSGMGKYVSLRRSGNHLYVFPGHQPQGILAVCEGAMGAIVAAESGLSVGAIQGCERFRASPSPEMLDGEPDDPLLELGDVDFGGRTVPYIPDADDPPNPRVLKAAPKASRWISEPRNGRAAICLLPKGADLDEWLLSIPEGQRAKRFAALLATANPPEDGGSLRDANPTEENPPQKGTEKSSTDKGSAPAKHKKTADKEQSRDAKEVSQADPQRPGQDAGAKEDHSRAQDVNERGVSRGARKLRDGVYTAVLEILSLKSEHRAVLEKQGVLPQTAAVGGFVSLDRRRAKKLVAELSGRFGAKKLASVPGFELDAMGKVRFTLQEECLLLPCYGADGLLSGLEALEVDDGGLLAEETLPLAGAGSHLYIFKAYGSQEIEGFCEGVLGALLAAQEDVVLGAIGGFRRYKAASGPGEARGRQRKDAVLPGLEKVDFDDRYIPYAPRDGVDVANARYHEATPALCWLVEKQNGSPAIIDFRREVEVPKGRKSPTSLGEWILTLPEEDRQERLRELFPESPVRQNKSEDSAVPGEGFEKNPSGEATDLHLKDRWHLHEMDANVAPSGALLTPSEVLASLLVWPVAYLMVGWLISATQWTANLAAELQMIQPAGTLVSDSRTVSLLAATVAAAFVLYRRRAIRTAELRTIRGRIRH